MRSIVVMAVLMIVAALPAAYSALPDYIVLYFNFCPSMATTVR